jgi:peptidoglycan/LPS O-acetylase OafA/YrhL
VLFEANLGLICFFVLSGFLLYRPFARAALRGEGRVSTSRYAVRRIARIVPAYYACLGGCLLLYAAADMHELIPPASDLPMFAVFAQNYSLETIMGINAVTWTLCVEAAFYVLLPLVGLAALRLAPRGAGRQALLLGALVVGTLGWNLLVQQLDGGAVAGKALPAYLGHFALGMLVALWVERGIAAGAWRTALLVLAGVVLVVVTAYWHETLELGHPLRAVGGKLTAALGFALVIGAAAAGRGPAVSWLGNRALAAVGVVSYGLYLWHLPLILVGNELEAYPDALLPRLAVVLAIALMVAYLSWTLVERPAMNWAAQRTGRGRRFQPRHAQAAP